MNLGAVSLAGCVVTAAAFVHGSELVPDRDNIEIAADTRIKPGVYRLADGDENGVFRIVADNVTVDFQGAELVGAADQAPNAYFGKGVMISGAGVMVKNVKVRGFKVGIHARQAPGLCVEDVDVSDNYRERLRSTPLREAVTDWLSPHNNDNGQWLTRYGAGICVERSDNVTIRRVRARRGQNGIVLDRVSDSKIYDNDCSFLSGWGLAMWRCNRNVISRNAFDFCVRGYSHGVYNRGQDSAGILMFEQNNGNVIAENSATHCGDGFFGFGGAESLAGAGRTGNNGNLLIGNDFSYAAAHGIEMTFSFDNQFIGNRLVGNGICGIWGGYSQDTLIAGNTLAGNGEAGYGAERGGVNIEHGRGNAINFNVFKDNKCGVFLWSDEDTHLMTEPWVQANHKGSTDNTIAHNVFAGDLVGVQLRQTAGTKLISNAMKDVAKEIDTDESSQPEVRNDLAVAWKPPSDYPVHGRTRPVGARQDLRGREKIIITEWGPYDYVGCAIVPASVVGGPKAVFQVLGPGGRFKVTGIDGEVAVSPLQGDLPARLTVETITNGPKGFRVDVDAGETALAAKGHLLRADWTVKFFGWNPSNDPRSQPERWARLLSGPALEVQPAPAIDFDWAMGAPSRQVPPDHFGTLATTVLSLPAGNWVVHTISDDGIRVWIDGRLVIDDWTWHPPKDNSVVIGLAAGDHRVRIEHFEIDGYARLAFFMKPNGRKP